MKRELHIDLIDPRANPLARGCTPYAIGWLQDRFVSGKAAMA